MPDQIAGQVNGLTDKNLDVKLKDLQKNIQALDAKVQAMANKPAPAAPPAVNNQKEVIAEIQKLKKDLEAANAAALKAAAKEREREKALDKPLTLPKALPAVKPADNKAAAEAKAAEAKAIAEAKAAAEAKAQAEIKAANEARAAAEAKAAAEARARAAAEAKAAEAARAAAQPPALPPRAAPKEDRVIFPRPSSEN
jgi:hypothetical protein